MKKILLLLLMSPVIAKSQCIGGSCEREGSKFSFTFQVDNSLRYYQPSGFSGIGVYAGVWAGSLGFVVGGVDSRSSTKFSARRDLTFGMMTRIHLFEDNLQLVPFFNVGTNNYQDAGLRIGYKVSQGIYAGVMTSLTMNYGITISATVHK
jgi:hypothetical protein